MAGSDPRPSFDWTLRYGTIRGARVGVPYSIHEEDVARIVTEIDALVRRYRLRLATLTLDNKAT